MHPYGFLPLSADMHDAVQVHSNVFADLIVSIVAVFRWRVASLTLMTCMLNNMQVIWVQPEAETLWHVTWQT